MLFRSEKYSIGYGVRRLFDANQNDSLEWSSLTELTSYKDINPNTNAAQNLGTSSKGWLDTHTKTVKLHDSSATPNIVTVTVPSSVTPHTLTLPSAQGSANQVLTNNGSGTLSWTTPTVYSNTSLSNLSTTSINQSLLPSINDSMNLGSSSKNWSAIYFTSLMDNNDSIILDNSRNLLDSSGNSSINTDDRALYNSLNVLSLSYENRTLNNDYGPVLDWSASTLKTYNDLLPNVTNNRNLGSDTKTWANIWTYNQKLKGLTSGTLSIKAADTTTDHTLIKIGRAHV